MVSLSLFLILPLLAPNAALDDCGTMTIPKCHMGDVTGNSCQTSDNRTCLEDKDWCPIIDSENFLQNEHCKGYENLMLENCLSLTTAINGIEYLVVDHQAHWPLAEQYCQSKGYNLISFSSQTEYNDVVELLSTLRRDPKNIGSYKGAKVRVSDPVARRCHDRGDEPMFWTGLFFDRNLGKWKYSNGAKVHGTVRSIQNSIGDVIKSDKKGYVKFFARNFTFDILKTTNGQAPKIDEARMRARILCKRITGKPAASKKWLGGPKPANVGCITGFKCDNKKCLKGAMFRNTDVCNGVKDCEDGEDESPHLCSSFISAFPDNRRNAHFIPVARNPKLIRTICKSRNLTLPSVRSNQDIQFLKSLPSLYANTKSEASFWDYHLVGHAWNGMAWKMAIGIKKGQKKWDDGSNLSFLKSKIESLKSKSDVFLYSDGTIKDEFGQTDDVFVVCQEKRPMSNPTSQPRDSNFGRHEYSSVVVLVVFVLFSMVAL